jgi:hypothetical protein
MFASQSTAIRRRSVLRKRGALARAAAAALALLLGACNLPSAVSQGGGPRAWIDAPLDGSSLQLGPVTVVAHGADPGGMALVEFSVDGVVQVEPGAPDEPQPGLASWEHIWQPGGPGNYRLQVRVQNRGGVWSAPAEAQVTILPVETATPTITATSTATATPTASPTPACSLRAQFVADVTVPDGTMFAPGTAFTKTWRLRNAGDCEWGRGFSLVFVDGAPMSGTSPLPLPQTVAPDATVDASVNLVAPSAFGRQRGEWMLQDPQGHRFGIGADGQVAFWVEIVVGVTPTVPSDTQAPNVRIVHSPSGASILAGTLVTFTSSASDNVGVARIEIWISYTRGGPQLVQTCNGTTDCAYRSTFPEGTISYYARAYDAAGNMGSTGETAITFYLVR